MTSAGPCPCWPAPQNRHGRSSCQFEDVPKGHFAPVAANGESPRCRQTGCWLPFRTRSERAHLLHLRSTAMAPMRFSSSAWVAPRLARDSSMGFTSPSISSIELASFSASLCNRLKRSSAMSRKSFRCCSAKQLQNRHAVLEACSCPMPHHRLQLRDFGTVFRSRLGSLPARQVHANPPTRAANPTAMRAVSTALMRTHRRRGFLNAQGRGCRSRRG